MALKILNRDGSTTTITDEDERQIDDYTRGKSLAEIAAEPPRFSHLLKRKDKQPGLWRRFLSWLKPKAKTEPWPALSRAHLDSHAADIGVSTTGSDDELRRRIVEKFRGYRPGPTLEDYRAMSEEQFNELVRRGDAIPVGVTWDLIQQRIMDEAQSAKG